MKLLNLKPMLFALTCGSIMAMEAQEVQPVLAYSFEQQQAADDSGKYPFALYNNAFVLATEDGNHVLSTGESNGYADLGTDLGREVLAGLSGDYSVSIDLCVGADNALGSYCWAWALTNGTGAYMALVNAAGNGDWYYEIKNGTAQSVHASRGVTTDEWHTLTVVQQSGTCTYYMDGVAVKSGALTLNPSGFAATFVRNYLARSPFAGDAYMRNTLMDNFKVYDVALTAAQVEALYAARPVSKEVKVDVSTVLQVVRDELYLGQAAKYIHNRLELPEECSYGTVEWTFTPAEAMDGNAEISFADGVFTVVRRADIPVLAGELQGTITYEGVSYPVYETPVPVTIAPDDHAYGYLYCHMPNLVPETGVGTLVSQVITYALGTEEDKGLVFNELNRGSSIIDGIGTALPWCRDAFMAKDKKRGRYYIVTTDLYGSRDGGTSMLENYSIGMFRSYDLINWTYTRCDMKQYLREHPVTDIYDNTGTKLLTADKVSRVWAPQIVFIDGDPYIYYAVGNTDNGDCDHFYISKANEDFTGITSFQMLYGANTQDNVLDADINYLETDGLYHMSYRDYAAGGILDITTEDLLCPQWSTPVSSFQDGSGYEASSVFRRINDDVWNVGNVNYGNNVGYHFHTADAMLRNLQPAADMSGNLSPQHGSFVYVTETEYRLLQAWSDLKALIADGEALLGRQESEMLRTLVDRAKTDIATDNGADTDLEALAALLQEDFVQLQARMALETALSQARAANFSGVEGREGWVDRLYNGGRLAEAIVSAETAGLMPDAEAWNIAAGELDEALKGYYETLASDGEPLGIRNGDFANGTSGWTLDGTANTGDGVAEFFALRAVDYSVSIGRTQRELAEGYYLVKCQAFERNGENDHTGRNCREGVEKINYEFFAGDVSVPVRSLYELPYDGSGSWHGFANNMASASALFSASGENYANYLLVYVADGRLTFGLRRPVSTVHSSDWCCFDNFEVYSLDKATAVSGVKADVETVAGKVYDLGGVSRGSVGADGGLPSLQKGVYIVNGKKVLKK